MPRLGLAEEARVLYEHGFRPAQIARILYMDEWRELEELKRRDYNEYRRRYNRLVNRALKLLRLGSRSSRGMAEARYGCFELNVGEAEEPVLDPGWNPIEEEWMRSDEWRDKPVHRKIRAVTREERWKIEYEEIMYSIYCSAGLHHYDLTRAAWLKARAIHEAAWPRYLELLREEARNYYHKNKKRYPAQVVAYCYLCLASALIALRIRYEAFQALKKACVMYVGDEEAFTEAVEALSHLFVKHLLLV